MDFELVCKAEYFIGANRGIVNMIDSGLVGKNRYFIILDSNGCTSVLKFGLDEENPVLSSVISSQNSISRDLEEEIAKAIEVDDEEKLIQLKRRQVETPKEVSTMFLNMFHAGAITGMDTSPTANIVATGGADCSVRFTDFSNRKLLASRNFSSPITCLRWVPAEALCGGQSIVCGFADGTVRVLCLVLGDDSMDQPSYISLKMAFKPHNAAVVDISFSGKRLMASAGRDGIVFFFNCATVYMCIF